MSVTDARVNKSANHAVHTLNFPVTTALSQAALLAGAWTPGFKFQVIKVSVFATGVTATISADVQIGGTSVLTGAVTPVAGTETEGTLSGTLSKLRGSATSQLQVKYTTNGTGAGVNLMVSVQIRPYP